ncbi:sulfotransferase family 2 domain-containing protein [Burkholderia cepacia]|uniref:hypothetical protein n=1 Tax=Burkholderia cepacia TaxID=292 RepID=UPI003A4E465A
MRFVIVHYHLYKNAGTTIDDVLARNFPEHERGILEGEFPWSEVSPAELLEYTLANPGLRVISSHQARLPLPEHPDITFLPILFLRHPIDRFGSVYRFERQQALASPTATSQAARNSSMPAFAEWVVSREANAVCRNFQVLILGAGLRDIVESRATPSDYLGALARLKALPFFGIVEEFEASLRRLQDHLRPYFGEIDLNYQALNVSADLTSTLEERLQDTERELGPLLYRELVECNALDLLLYRDACELFAAEQ